MFEQKKQFEVTKLVTGRFKAIVTAESEAEAQDIANDMCSETDFGALEEIDWENGSICEV